MGPEPLRADERFANHYQIEAMPDGQPVVFFTSGPLDQWWPAPFTVDGDLYPTAEHWMMAEKARVFGDDETRALILAGPDPEKAKDLGRGVKGFDEAVWTREAPGVVYRGNLAKFADPLHRAFLLESRGALLVEAAGWDPIWGIGVDHDSLDRFDRSKWGRNQLGQVLTAVRWHYESLTPPPV